MPFVPFSQGLAIASATLTAVGLIAAFVEQSGLEAAGGPNSDRVVDLSDALVLTAVLLGACLPYIFAALTMLSVDRGARAIITEVRLQFATAPRLMLGDATQCVDGHMYPDSTRCVQIATEAAIQEMVLPGVLAVFVPVVIGFILGPKGTTGLLAGALGGCFMLALTMATAGGAWDNAKKWCERCAVEGAPVPGQKGKVSFTTFGVKKMANFENLLREHGIEAFVKDTSLLPVIRSMVRYIIAVEACSPRRCVFHKPRACLFFSITSISAGRCRYRAAEEVRRRDVPQAPRSRCYR